MSFLKWVGGKARLASQLVSLFPANIDTYYEPFLGAGHVFFKLKPNSSRLSDLNEDLINTYIEVQRNPSEVISIIKNISQDPDTYYAIRHEFNTRNISGVQRAAYFIYMNRCGYNGLYRVNKSGKFNVPFGKNAAIGEHIFSSIREGAKTLQTSTLDSYSFETILSLVTEGDFVYLDPPYFPEKENSFTSYNKGGFSREEHKKVFDFCVELDNRNVKFLLSSSDVKDVSLLFKRFKSLPVVATRSISCSTNRGKHKEIIIFNYEIAKTSSYPTASVEKTA